MSFRTKILLLAVCGTIASSTLLIAITFTQKQTLDAVVLADVDAKAEAEIRRLASQVHDTLALCDHAEQEHVRSNLKLIADRVSELGVSLDTEQITWNAVNQFDKSIREVSLPRMLLAGDWLGQTTDPAAASPLVDGVHSATEGGCTIFQRMNEAGDMLRIATSVIGANGQRAVGTYIPALQPDGTPNPVVAALMRGEAYCGRAFVVDSWWNTGYQPIADAEGNVIGAVFCGRPQDSMTQLMKHIREFKIGESGRAFVLQGSGASRGTYLVAPCGDRDGELAIDEQDAEGRHVVREWIEAATEHESQGPVVVSSVWPAKEESGDQLRAISAVTYFAPWDWVIGVTSYEKEYRQAAVAVQSGLNGLMTMSAIGGLLFSMIAAGVSLFAARRLVKPIRVVDEISKSLSESSHDLADIADRFSQGAQDSASSLEETAASLEQLTATVRQNAESAQQASQLAAVSRERAEEGAAVVSRAVAAMGEINRSSREIADITSAIDEIAFQTNLLALNAAVEAARAGEQGRGFAVVAGEVRTLAQRSSAAAHNIKGLIENSVQKVDIGTQLVNQSGETLDAIVKSARHVTDVIARIADASREQNAGIDQINIAVSRLDQVTQQSASQTEGMSDTASSLAHQADELKQSVAVFYATAPTTADEPELV